MQSILERIREGAETAQEIAEEVNAATQEIAGEVSSIRGTIQSTIQSQPAVEPVPVVPTSVLDTGDFVVIALLLFMAGAAGIAYYLNRSSSKEDGNATVPEGPAVVYRFLRLIGLFGIVAAGAIFLQHTETIYRADAPGSEMTVNQLHRWAQFSANSLWGLLNWVLHIDILSFHFANFRELVYNKPDPGREAIYKPIDDRTRPVLLAIYGLSLCVYVYAANIVFGV